MAYTATKMELSEIWSPARAAFSLAARSACQCDFRGEIRNCHAYGMVLFVQSATADTLRVRSVVYW